MRKETAERLARKFVAEQYPEVSHDRHFDIALEQDGARHKSWSFGLRPDAESEDDGYGECLVGYVHANGYVEGLY